jgi:hypothetical protein
MKEVRCDNLWDMFKTIKPFKTEVLSCDDPKRLLIGWLVTSTDTFFCVSLRQIRTREAMQIIPPIEKEGKEIARKKLERLVISSSGRHEIAKYLSDQLIVPEFSMIIDEKLMERLNNLKAFW